MSLLSPRWPARDPQEPTSLPAPGPFPAALTAQHYIVIFVVVISVVVWLLARGDSIDTALGAVAAAGALAASIARWLMGTQPSAG